jgi:hypothetical protein
MLPSPDRIDQDFPRCGEPQPLGSRSNNRTRSSSSACNNWRSIAEGETESCCAALRIEPTRETVSK